MLKKVIFVLILLLIISLMWVGISVYEAKFAVDVNPNASTYVKPISPNFHTEGFDLVKAREKNLVVLPSDLRGVEHGSQSR